MACVKHSAVSPSGGYACFVSVAASGFAPPAFWVGLAIAAAAGIVVGLDARRRGDPYAPAWGLGVFLLLALVLPLYIFRVRRSKQLPAGQAKSGQQRDEGSASDLVQPATRIQPVQMRAFRLVAFFALLVLMNYWGTPVWLEVLAVALLAFWLARNDLQSRHQKR
jgi:hypothetical protein